MAPCVTFVVPAFKLAHLLGDCLRSIVGQSFSDFEVLVMDDCSPDDVASVVEAVADPRVRHVRHARNLGHLENYNTGIKLARGRYLWLISADDRLRSTDVLAAFVRALDEHPDATFVFCPAMGLTEGVETGIVPFCWHPPDARVLAGRAFASFLLAGNKIASPACLVRTSAYHQAGLFPLDLPYAGDWYLWCRFALAGRVVYLPAPMVHYRLHPESMTTALSSGRPQQILRDDVAVRWRIMHDAAAIGADDVAAIAAELIARDYAGRIAGAAGPHGGLSLAEALASIDAHAASPREAAGIAARMYEEAGDAEVKRGDCGAARALYARAMRGSRPAFRLVTKRSLLSLGGTGVRLRVAAAALRDAVQGAR